MDASVRSSRKPQKALKLKGGFKNDAKGDTKKKEETKVDAADEIAQANALRASFGLKPLQI